MWCYTQKRPRRNDSLQRLVTASSWQLFVILDTGASRTVSPAMVNEKLTARFGTIDQRIRPRPKKIASEGAGLNR